MATHDGASLRLLLDAALDGEHTWSGEDLGAVLEHQLRTPLTAELEALAACSGEPPEQLRAMLAASPAHCFADALEPARADPQRLALLRLVKALARDSLDGDGLLPAEVARVIYVTAVCAAGRADLAAVSALHPAAVQRECRRCLTHVWLPGDARARLLEAMRAGGWT